MKKIDQAAQAYKKNGFVKSSDPVVLKKDETSRIEKVKKEDKQKEIDTKSYIKTAKLVLVAGPKQAAEILKQFRPDEIEKIAKEIANIKRVGKVESEKILTDYKSSSKTHKKVLPQLSGVVKGGADKAQTMLQAALGEEKGMEMFKKILPFGGRRPFDFLEELHPEQVLFILKNEPPYVMSIVFSFLKPELSSVIISKLPPESRKEIILRIANQRDIAPGIIEKMEGVFRDRIRTQGRMITEEIDGKSVLANILRNMDANTEEQILKDITKDNKDIAKEIKKNIYNIDLILKMSAKDVQFLLSDFDNSELAIIIKGKSEDVKKCILKNVSERRKGIILEESIHLGEMLKSEVDKATAELVDYLMELERSGEILIRRGEEDWI